MKNINNNPFFKRQDKDTQFEALLKAIKHFKLRSNGIIAKVTKQLKIKPRLLKREIEKLDLFV